MRVSRSLPRACSEKLRDRTHCRAGARKKRFVHGRGGANRIGRVRGSLGSALGQSEIEDFRLIAAGHENVGGLDVSMDDAFGVSRIERVRDLNAEID